MKESLIDMPPLDVQGLVFYLTTLRDVIPSGPNGIYLKTGLLVKKPVLRSRVRNGVCFTFIAFDRHGDKYPDGVIDAPVALYAEIKSPSEDISSSIEQAIAGGTEPAKLTSLAQNILKDGYELSCEFVNILRHDYGQYFIRQPEDPSGWTSIRHFSKSRQKWFSIGAGSDFAAKLLEKDWGSESERTHRWFIMLKAIGEEDLAGLAAAESAPEPTFADELVSTALVELKHNRIRSAIVHAFIAYEIATKRSLEKLLQDRLNGLELGSILEAIAREVNTVTLGRIVLHHANSEPSGSPLDWDKIKAIHTTRNLIIHRGQRRMPPFEDIKAQILEIRKFVICLQNRKR